MTMLRAWGPTINTLTLHRTMDRPFDGETTPAAGVRRPVYDLYETAGEFVLRAWMPGIDPTALEVTFERGMLQVSASAAAAETPAEGTVWYRRELPATGWKLAFRLPRELDAEQADAAYENGVLTLRLPKAESARPHTIQVRTTV
jgi:HSP20 family protein